MTNQLFHSFFNVGISVLHLLNTNKLLYYSNNDRDNCFKVSVCVYIIYSSRLECRGNKLVTTYFILKIMLHYSVKNSDFANTISQ